MKKSVVPPGMTTSQMIDGRIHELGDWRGKLLARLRALIQEGDPDVVEDWKWNVPVWKHDGLICTGETYKSTVKLTFANGASLPDPAGLFNSSLEGNTRRAIDFREGGTVNAAALKALVAAAVAFNTGAGPAPRKAAKAKTAATASTAKAAKPKAAAKATKKAAPRKAAR